MLHGNICFTSFYKLWKIETNFKDGLVFLNIPSKEIVLFFKKNETYLSFDIGQFCTNAPSQPVFIC